MRNLRESSQPTLSITSPGIQLKPQHPGDYRNSVVTDNSQALISNTNPPVMVANPDTNLQMQKYLSQSPIDKRPTLGPQNSMNLALKYATLNQ